MALTPQNNEAFLREVDEELRRDQAQRFWRRWGRWVVIGAAAALLAFAGYLYWQHRQREAAAERSVVLQKAYDDLGAGKFAAVRAPLADLAQNGDEGYRAAAVFTQADVLLKDNDLKGAAAKFASIANDASMAQPLRDLALIRQTSAEFDALKPDVVVSRLRGLAAPGGAWLGSAGELVAAAYLRQGRRDLAGQMFARIAAAEGVPPTLRQRAVQMAGVLGVDAVKTEGTAR